MRISSSELLPLLGAGMLFVIHYLGRYVILPYASHLIGVWLWKYVVKDEHQAVIWAHHKFRTLRQGHKPKTPRECGDGQCVRIG